MADHAPGGTLELADGLRLSRIGLGAMQLGPTGARAEAPSDEVARAVLEAAVAGGVTHVDTADFYGPGTVNQRIRSALHPYPDDLVVVTKVGARWTERGLRPALDDLEAQVHANLEHLGLDVLPVVNLRVGRQAAPAKGSISAPFEVLAELQQRGLVRHLGISNVSSEQVEEASSIAPLVCVQNNYNLAHRDDEPLVARTAAQGVAFVPYFPLGGFSPVQSEVVDDIALALGASPMQVALAWLLQHSPNLLLIPGTGSVAHLRDDLAAARLRLTPSAVAELDDVAAG